jgi:hypothetical protein
VRFPQELWEEIESRMTEMEKKLIYTPNRELVETWARAGLLSVRVAK